MVSLGRRAIVSQNTSVSKYKCKWYNNECEVAKRRFEYTNKQYRRCKSVCNRTLMINERSRYNRVKRKARREYYLTQRQYFSDLAKRQPQSFWKELKKVKKNNSTNTNCTNISEDDFLNF